MRWIEAACEPLQLILAWQPAALDAPRFRWAVGRVTRTGSEFELRYFQPGMEFEQYNSGKKYADLIALGYVGYPAFKTDSLVHGQGVRQALMRRLPPRHRSDFGDYAAQFRLKDTEKLSDFTLLGRTEAKVPSDGFSLIDPLDADALACDLLIEVAGYRHYADDENTVKVGDRTRIVAEPDNPYDPNAVAIYRGDRRIGYINRLQSGSFLSWLEGRTIDSIVERINGSTERPRVFLFVQVRPHHALATA